MIICYYTYENGDIYAYHSNNGKSYDELKALEIDFNSKHKSEKAHITVVDDNSLTAYLFNECKEKTVYEAERISDIRRALSDVDDMIADLESTNK